MLDSRELADITPVTRICLLRWQQSAVSYQQLLLINTLSNRQPPLQILQLPLQYCSAGYLPLILINQSIIITKQRFVTLCQTFFPQTELNIYLLRRAVADACKLLTCPQEMYEVQGASKYWMLVSPLKKLREFLMFKHTVRKLKGMGLKEDGDNMAWLEERLRSFVGFLGVEDVFCRVMMRACVMYYEQRESYLAEFVRANQEVAKFMKIRQQIIPEQPLFVVNPKQQTGQPKPTTSNPPNEYPKISRFISEQAKIGLAKLTIATLAVWLPYLMLTPAKK